MCNNWATNPTKSMAPLSTKYRAWGGDLWREALLKPNGKLHLAHFRLETVCSYGLKVWEGLEQPGCSRGVSSKVNLVHVLRHHSEMWVKCSKHALSKELLLKHISTQSKMLKFIYLHVPKPHFNCEVKCINEKPLSTLTVILMW